MSENKRETIASYQLFSVMLLSRVMSLLSVRGILSLGELFISFFLSVLLIIVCLKIKIADSFFLSALCVIVSAFEVARFSFFLLSEKKGEVSSALIILLLLLSSMYAAKLGIEALSRFSLIVLAVVLVTAFFVVFSNIKAFDTQNLLVAFKCKFTPDLFLVSDVPVIYLKLKNNVKEKAQRSLKKSVFFSYFIAAVVYTVSAGAIGRAEGLYNYSVFKLFQLGNIGTFARFDAFFISIWLLALFLKISVLLHLSVRKND